MNPAFEYALSFRCVALLYSENSYQLLASSYKPFACS